MAVIGDVLRILPNIVLGFLQGQRLRQQLQREREEEEYERFKRAFDVWQMKQQIKAAQDAERAIQAFYAGYQKLISEEPEEGEPITPTVPPTQPLTPPKLSVPQTTQPLTPPKLSVPQTISIHPTRRRQPLIQLPPLQLHLPTMAQPQQQPTPMPQVDYDERLRRALRSLDKLNAVYTYLQTGQAHPHPQIKTLTAMELPKVSAVATNIFTQVKGILAEKLIREGKAADYIEVRRTPDFWDAYISALEPYKNIPFVQQEIQLAQNERDNALRLQQRKEELDYRREEQRWRRKETLARILGSVAEGYDRRVDRLFNTIVQVRREISRLASAAQGRLSLTPEDLRSIRNIVDFASQALVALGKDKAQTVLNSVDAVIDAVMQGKEESASLATQLLEQWQKLEDILWQKLFAASYVAQQYAALHGTLTQEMLDELMVDVSPDEAARILGLKRGDMNAAYRDLLSALDAVPEEEPQPTPPPAQPAPTQQPTQQPQPTMTLRDALRTLVLGAVAGRATELQTQNIEQQLRIEGMRLSNAIKQVQVRFLPELQRLRVVDLQTGIQRTQVAIQQMLQEMQYPPMIRDFTNDLAQRLGSLIGSLKKRDASGQLQNLTGDEAARLLIEGLSAAYAAVSGNRKPLQDFVNKLRKYEVAGRQVDDFLAQFLQALGITPPQGQQPTQQTPAQQQRQQPTQQPQRQQPTQQKRQQPPLYKPPEERDLDELIGGM